MAQPPAVPTTRRYKFVSSSNRGVLPHHQHVEEFAMSSMPSRLEPKSGRILKQRPDR